MLKMVRRLSAVGRDYTDMLALIRMDLFAMMEIYLTYAFAEMGEEVEWDGTGKVDTE
jgi:hypothetical protein